MASTTAHFAALVAAVALVTTAASCDDGKDKAGRADIKAAKNKGKADDGKAEKPAAPAGKVFFVEPKDGATVPTKFDVKMGVEGKTVRAAGAVKRDPLFGHHHILIDGAPLADLTIVPKDEKNLHYGTGATETTLMLTPGKHTLTMQFADGAHRSYGPDWAATITVNVTEGPATGDAPADGKAADGKAPDAKAADGKAPDAKAGG